MKKNSRMIKKVYSGFYLIEILYSIFILSFGIIVVYKLFSSGTTETIGSREHISATLLAQEGIELTRNIRDNNWAQLGRAFGTGFPASAADCTIDASLLHLPRPRSPC